MSLYFEIVIFVILDFASLFSLVTALRHSLIRSRVPVVFKNLWESTEQWNLEKIIHCQHIRNSVLLDIDLHVIIDTASVLIRRLADIRLAFHNKRGFMID